MEVSNGNNLSRCNTLNLCDSEFGSLDLFPDIQNTSFHERFDTKDISDLLQTPRVTLKESEVNQHENFWGSFRELRSESKARPTTQNDSSNAKVSAHPIIPKVGQENYVHVDQVMIPVYSKYVEKIEADTEDATTVLFFEANPHNLEMGIATSEGEASLSMQPLPGDLNFSVNLNSNQHNNNKWCFSKILDKVFVQNHIAVPIEVTVNHWIDSYVNITPVFVEYQNQPVRRCHFHELEDSAQKLECAEHMVQVENPEARYKFTNNRHSVDIPLGIPAAGENSKTLFVKLGCWNTCKGGPGRKKFSLIFTLFDGYHNEIGRQMVNLKVCSCPKRDMELEERKLCTLINNKKKTSTKRRCGKSEKKMISSKKIKMEAAETHTQMNIPLEFVPQVKRLLNQLVAEKMARLNPTTSQQLPYPDL